MKPLRAAVLALMLSIPATPAHAALVGLIGLDIDPVLITDPTLLALGSCAAVPAFFGFNGGERCAFYHFAGSGIASLDFQLNNGTNYISFFSGTVGLDPRSQLSALDLSNVFGFPDPFTMNLSNGFIRPPFCQLCGPGLVFYAAPDAFHTASALLNFSVASVGVNGVPNPGAAAIPEPATLVLLGPAGLAMLARRWQVRRRVRQN